MSACHLKDEDAGINLLYPAARETQIAVQLVHVSNRFASHFSNREVKRTHPMIEKDSPEDARQPRRRLSIHGLEVRETAAAMGPRLGQGANAEWRRRRAFYSRINAERE